MLTPGGVIQRVVECRTEYLTLDDKTPEWVDSQAKDARLRAVFFPRYADADARAHKLRAELGQFIFAAVAVKALPHRPIIDPIGETDLSGGVESRHAKRSNGGNSPPRPDATDSAACIRDLDHANVSESKAQEPAIPIGSGSSAPPAQKISKRKPRKAEAQPRGDGAQTKKFWWREDQYA